MYMYIYVDPTAKREAKLQRYLLRLHRNGALSKEEYEQVRPTGSTPARIYGLPKTHKDNVPLRPIISSIGTYNYSLAKFLVRMLQPVSKGEFCVKDSFSFAREVRALPSIPYMCSFDVKSLFTNVPLVETIDICVSKLFQNNDSVHGFTRNEFKQLLLFATQQSHFLFNGNVFDQIDGVAMGSPLAPVLADIFMSTLEERFLASYSGIGPGYYRRYVDDTFLVFNNSAEALSFFAYVNSQHPNIKFTMDSENNSSLPFLDVKIDRTANGIETSVYRKPSFSGLYQKWSSCIPKSFKRSLVSGLFFRSWSICSNAVLFEREVGFIRTLLRQNGYPSKFINDCFLAFIKKQNQTPSTEPKVFGPYKKPIFLNLPYLGHESDILKKQIKRVVSAAIPWAKPLIHFKTSFSLRSLSKLKDKIPLLTKSKVVYKVNCPTCSQFYIGQTSRRLSQRMHEHRFSTNGPIRTHQDTTGHVVNTTSPQILASDSNNFRLLIKETLLIREQGADRSLNGNIGTGKLLLW